MLFHYSASTLTVTGIELQPNAVICLRNPSDTDYPEFGKITDIIYQDTQGSQCLLLVMIMTTVLYEKHYNAYRVCKTSNYKLVTFNHLAIMDVFVTTIWDQKILIIL